MRAPVPYEPRVPSDSMPPGRAAISVTWAALPFLTLGYATPFTFAAAALWRRSAHLLVASAAYIGVFVLMLTMLPDMGKESGSSQSTVGALMFVLAVIGCAHAFMIRRKVFDPDGLSGVDNDKAIEQVRRDRALRTKARELAAGDPKLARDLRIGRPDLPRQYNDGGLVDVNHAPAEVLTLLPGVTPELAVKIERVRSETGGFISAEELAALAGLPPTLTTELGDYAVFIR